MRKINQKVVRSYELFFGSRSFSFLNSHSALCFFLERMLIYPPTTVAHLCLVKEGVRWITQHPLWRDLSCNSEQMYLESCFKFSLFMPWHLSLLSLSFPTSTQPFALLSQVSPHIVACPWVAHKCSLVNPFTFLHAAHPRPSGSWQSVACIYASVSILFISFHL